MTQLRNNATDGERRSGIVLLHDWYGLDEVTLALAARLESQGFAVHAPDLFSGLPLPEERSDAAMAAWAAGQYDTAMVARVLAAVDELTAREAVNPSQVGLAGLGWGGTYALLAAAHDGRIRAAATIGGAISYPVLTAQRPGSPLNFVANIEGALFAAYAGDDSLNPGIEIERMRGRLVEHDKIGEVKVYDAAPPRFWRDANLPQTAALWSRLEQFFNSHLRPHSPARLAYDDILAREEGFADAKDAETGYHNEESRLHA